MRHIIRKAHEMFLAERLIKNILVKHVKELEKLESQGRKYYISADRFNRMIVLR